MVMTCIFPMQVVYEKCVRTGLEPKSPTWRCTRVKQRNTGTDFSITTTSCLSQVLGFPELFILIEMNLRSSAWQWCCMSEDKVGNWIPRYSKGKLPADLRKGRLACLLGCQCRVRNQKRTNPVVGGACVPPRATENWGNKKAVDFCCLRWAWLLDLADVTGKITQSS